MCAGFGANAAVWDAFGLLLFHRRKFFEGTACFLVSAAFDTLALQEMQPHVLAALNGIGVVLSVVWSSGNLSVWSWVSLGFVVAGAVVGLLGIAERTNSAHHTFGSVSGLLMAGFVLVDAYPVWVLWRHGRARVVDTSLHYLLPFGDALLAGATTALLASQASNARAVAPFLLAGAVGLGSTWLSLGCNSVRQHVIISFPVWSGCLVLVDFAGGYPLRWPYFVAQLACTLISGIIAFTK